LDDEEDEEEEEIELVLFKGALSGIEVDLSENQRLASAALIPAKELITDAIMRRANRLRVEPKGQRAAVAMSIDGMNYPGDPLPGKQALAITQMVKLLAGLNIQERNQQQKGGIVADLEGHPYQLLVQADPVGGGLERLTIGIRDKKVSLERPQEIGIPDAIREQIRTRTGHRKGVFVVCGPPFTGVTTSLVGTLRSVDSFIYSVFSIADLEGRDLTNITKEKFREGEDLATFVGRLQRVEADVLHLGPIKDAQTAQEIFAQAERMTMITEMPARDAATAVCQLISWLEPEGVLGKLELVLSSKLIRKLCEKCREAYRPHPKLLAKLGLPPETKLLYRPPVPPDEEDEDYAEWEPCGQCGGLGYFGQAAMFEMIDLANEQMAGLLAKKPSPDHVRAAQKKLGMPTQQAGGIQLIVEGKTSLEELQRVFRGR
jgi:type IV pilus assembly protein PilB